MAGAMHLIAGPDSQSGQRQMNGGSAAAHSERVGRALCNAANSCSKRSTRAPIPIQLAANAVRNRGDLLLAEHWCAKNQPVFTRSKRGSALDCGQIVGMSQWFGLSANQGGTFHTDVFSQIEKCTYCN